MTKKITALWAGLLEGSASPGRELAKRKRGAPRKNGMQPAWMLYRAMLIIEGYQKYRMSGLSHRESREKAVQHAKAYLPDKMPVSPREVDRALAAYHSDRRVEGFVVKRRLEDVPVFGDAALGFKFVKFEKKEVLDLFVFPRPKYQKRPKKLPALDFSRKFK